MDGDYLDVGVLLVHVSDAFLRGETHFGSDAANPSFFDEQRRSVRRRIPHPIPVPTILNSAPETLRDEMGMDIDASHLDLFRLSNRLWRETAISYPQE
jgi:hypothetical protein